MTQFQVDSDAVSTATSAAHSALEQLRADAAALTGHLTSLQNSWTGAAAAAFQTVATEWRATHQRLEESAQSINAALAVAGQQYADTEAANARLFAG